MKGESGFKLKGKHEHDDDDDDDADLTQRDKMSSESLTGAKFDDLWCHWFPVGGSLLCRKSAGDRRHCLGRILRRGRGNV